MEVRDEKGKIFVLASPEKDGNLVVACFLNGIPVVYCPKHHSSKLLWAGMIGRTIKGAAILRMFFPRLEHSLAAAAGFISQFWNSANQTGYYDRELNLIFLGTIELGPGT